MGKHYTLRSSHLPKQFTLSCKDKGNIISPESGFKAYKANHLLINFADEFCKELHSECLTGLGGLNEILYVNLIA